MSRTGPKNPHRSGALREPGRFEPSTYASPSIPAAEELVPSIWVATVGERQRRMEAMASRNAAADAAWNAALEPARLPLRHPNRVPYPEAARNALAPFDAVIAAHH